MRIMKRRRTLTPGQKAFVHAEAGGVCEICGNLVPVDGPGVEYDHRLQRWLDPDRLDELANFRPVHVRCHLRKTAQDAALRAKTKRQAALAPGVKRPKSAISSAPFRRDLRNKMNGRVEKR